MKIYSSSDNIYDAVDAVIKDGVVLLSGMKTEATTLGHNIIKNLEVYDDIEPHIDYIHNTTDGYNYYVRDLNKYSDTNQLHKIILEKYPSNYQ